MSRMIVTYEPDNLLKKGYFKIFGDIIDEIKRNRWLIYQFFKREFFAFYKQSLLGFIWAIIMPLASVFTFILLNRSGLFSIGDINVPYPIYALVGLAFWQLFSNGLLGSSNSLIKAGPMILKINFSKKSLVIASAGQSIIPFLILLALVAILLMWYGIGPHWGYFLIPFMLIPLLLLTIGLGFVIALLNGLMRDIGHMISILLTFLLFLTPVLYAIPKTGTLSRMTYYNPLYYLISALREIVLTGTVSEWREFLIVSVICVVLFIICLVAFHLTETRVAERI